MKKLLSLTLVLLMSLGLVACKRDGASGTDEATTLPSNTFHILAGSELKDMAEMVSAFGRTQNVNVVFKYTGTLDAVDRLAEAHQFDAVWVSHGKYLQLIPNIKS